VTRNPLWLAAVAVLLAACAGTPDPVLYPNAHLQTVGQAAAERDIAQCRQLASTSGVAEQRSGQVGSNAATGAAVGGASAGAWGLVRGNAAENALAGAAAGAAAGTVRGAIKNSETSPVYKNFVQKCLRDRGYAVIGWQ
jgi:outer membrane lipoprotein SlyB